MWSLTSNFSQSSDLMGIDQTTLMVYIINCLDEEAERVNPTDKCKKDSEKVPEIVF